MPRNRYSKLVRISERARTAQQMEEAARLARSLRKDTDSPAARAADGAKEHRRIRLEQKRRHKPEPSCDTDASQS